MYTNVSPYQCRENDCTESITTVLNEQFCLSYPVSGDRDDANKMTIRRNHIWRDAVRAMSRSTFDLYTYIQITFVGEEAVDDGRPRHEFLSLVLQEMAEDGNIFQGPQYSHFFVHYVPALAGRKFFYVGMLVAVSLANGRPGLACLYEAVYTYLPLLWSTLQVYPGPESNS